MIEKQTEYKLYRDMRGSVILDRIEYTLIIKCDTCGCKAVVGNLTEEEFENEEQFIKLSDFTEYKGKHFCKKCHKGNKNN